jgi:transposase
VTGSEARRRRAAELFAAGVRQAEVARQLGVSAQDVSVGRARFTGGGTEALRSRGPGGPAPRLSDARLDRVGQALLEGATANGFTGAVDAGTDRARDRTATRVQRHPAHVWTLPHDRLGWSVQRPKRRAGRTRPSGDRPLGQGALAAGLANAQRRRACLVFFDEGALGLTPNVRRTWAPRGLPPTLTHPFN